MSAGQVTQPNPVIDSTEDPFSPNAFTDVTGRDPETYQIRNNYQEHPSFVGFQLQDRPSIGTLRLYNASDSDDSNDSNIYGTEFAIIQTGVPNTSQILVNPANGWCKAHLGNLNSYVIAVYDSRGTNTAFDSVEQKVADSIGTSVEDTVNEVLPPLLDSAVDAAITVAIAGPIQDAIDTSVDAALDPISNYSTSEVAIGTWIDARTIYRKVLSVSLALGTPAYYDTPHGITGLTSGVSECLRVYGKFHANSTPEESLTIGGNYLQPVIQMTNGGNARMYSPQNLTGFTVDYIVMEYVK